MRLIFISKYPPIEGYVSSCTYWLARALASRGHDVTVVTNAFEVEDSHREHLEGADLDRYQQKGLTVRNTDPFQDLRLIPEANPFCEKLASAAIERSVGADVLDAWYLVSYGSAGMLAKSATGLPLVIRHAGSDLGRLAANPHLRPLICAMLKRADAVVASKGSRPMLMELGAPAKKIHEIPVSVDTGAFNPLAKPADLGTPGDVPVIACIGKITRGKGVRELFAAAAGIDANFRLLLVTSAQKNLKELKIPPALKKKLIIRPFTAPWKVPGIIRASRCVVMPEHDFPVKAHCPILPREVLACGTCLVISEELRRKVAGGAIVAGEHAVGIDPCRTDDFARKLEAIIRNRDLADKIGRAGHGLSERIEGFSEWLSANERMYREIV
jgi:glycosyltransferase involved in cell wall biosynthesis